MTAAKATACDEEPKTGTAAPFEDVVDGVWLVVPLLALLVVVTERRLLPVPVPVVLETEPVFTVELPGDVVEAGVVPVVLEPIAVVAALEEGQCHIVCLSWTIHGGRLRVSLSSGELALGLITNSGNQLSCDGPMRCGTGSRVQVKLHHNRVVTTMTSYYLPCYGLHHQR